MASGLHRFSHLSLAVHVLHPQLLTQAGGQLLQIGLTRGEQLSGSREIQADPGEPGLRHRGEGLAFDLVDPLHPGLHQPVALELPEVQGQPSIQGRIGQLFRAEGGAFPVGDLLLLVHLDPEHPATAGGQIQVASSAAGSARSGEDRPGAQVGCGQGAADRGEELDPSRGQMLHLEGRVMGPDGRRLIAA